MPTTNPVPSTDPSDLLFNAGKLDEVVNGTSNSFTDRLGVARRTVAGMNADFDAQLADAESDLNVYRADAAASAAEALGYLQTIRATSYGAYAEDPTTDPLGNPPTVGDEYFNTTANLLKRWNGTTWQASDINTANLAASSGSSLVGYDGGTVQDVLDGAKSLQDYAALRAYTGRATRICITGLLATAKPAGIAGVFQNDPTDTTSADNGGTVIVGADGRRWKRDFSGSVNVKWFGAKGDGSTDDTAAIQAAFQYASTLIFSPSPNNGSATFMGICPRIVFPKGVYMINNTITHSGSYPDVDGGECVITKGATFPDGGQVFNFTNCWQAHIRGFRFHGFKNAFRVYNNNLGMGHIRIENMHMQGGDVFLELYAKSSYTIVSDCRLDNVKHPLIVPGGFSYSGADQVKFVDTWIIPGKLTTDYDGYFRIAGGAKLILQNCFYNPNEQTAKDVVIIRVDDMCTVDVDGCLFGGEGGQVPLIGWHAAVGAPGTTRTGTIRVKDSSVFMSPSGSATNMPSGYRPVIELYAIPHAISLENLVGVSNPTAEGFIKFRSDFRTFDEALAINSDCMIDFIGRIGNSPNYFNISSALQLARFVRSSTHKFRGYIPDTNNSTTPIESSKVVVPIAERNRQRVFKLYVQLDFATTETYSEYLACTDFNGNWVGLKAVVEGSTTTAPRAFLDNGNIYIRANTATTISWAYWYMIEPVATLYQDQ